MINLQWISDIISSYKINASQETILVLESLEITIKEFIKESNKINESK